MHSFLAPSSQSIAPPQPYDLVALGFVSRSTHDLGILGLVNLCLQSYCNNVELGLTGILYFDGQHFGQIIEGRRDIVDERWQLILGDQRHDQIRLIDQKDVVQRIFSNWTMLTPDADAIVMLFPELAGMIRPIHRLYDGSEIIRLMCGYPTPDRERRIMCDPARFIHSVDARQEGFF